MSETSPPGTGGPVEAPPGRDLGLKTPGALLLIFAAFEFAFRSELLLGAVALFQRDLMLVYFPLMQAMLRELSNGALPLRDPTSAFGQPLLADPSCQILYPPTWLQILLPLPLAYAWFVSLHSVFGALGVALLARRISGGSFAAALVGGCAWLMSGPLQSLATLWHHMAGASWIPWVWLATERVLARRGPRADLVLGACAGAQMLAGSAEMCAGTLLIAALRVVTAWDWTLWKSWVKSGVVALTLSAGMWVPAAELITNTGRAAISESARVYWSLNPLSVFEFFLPLPISAFPLTKAWKTLFFEGREPFLASMYFGAPILPLCLAAFADPKLGRSIRASGLIGVACAVLAAFGKHAVFYSFLVALIPLLQIFRYPSKAMIPAAALFCVFAGVGVVSLRRSPRSRAAAMVGILILASLALGFTGPLLGLLERQFIDPSATAGIAEIRRNLPADSLWVIVILALLGAFMSLRSGRLALAALAILGVLQIRQSTGLHNGINPTLPTAMLRYRPEFLDVMRPPEGGRLYVYDYWALKGPANRFVPDDAPANWPKLRDLDPGAATLITSRAYMTPLVGAFWDVEYAWDLDIRMLFERRLKELTLDLRRMEGSPGFLKLLQVSGVHRVVTLHDEGMSDLSLLTRQDFHPRPLRVFAVPDPLPRAFLVSGRVKGTGNDTADLTNISFDPRASVLVDREPARPPIEGFEGSARIIEERSDHLIIETESNAQAFLGLLVGSMPGWRVWVDGAPAAQERANALFIGTEVPPGRHRVEARFLPGTAIAGFALTALSALFLLHAFVTAVRSRQEG